MPARQISRRVTAGTGLALMIALVVTAVATAAPAPRGPVPGWAAPLPGAFGPSRLRPAAKATASESDGPLVVSTLSFQTVRDAAGQAVALQADGCGAGEDLSALYVAQHGRAVLYHNYTGALAGCHLNRANTAGTVSAHWSTALTLIVALKARSTPKVVRHRVAQHCAESVTSAHFIATGRLVSQIHAARLGVVRRTRLTATLEKLVIPNCVFASNNTVSLAGLLGGTSTQASAAVLNGDQLEAAWGANESIFAETAHGTPSGFTFEEPARDGPTPQVQDLFAFTLEGGGAFTPAADLSSATLDFASPVSTGALSFTAGIGCPPTVRAEDGTFSGAATVDDPVLGRVRLSGSLMSQGQLSVVAADAYKCAPVNLGEQ